MELHARYRVAWERMGRAASLATINILVELAEVMGPPGHQ